MLTPPYLCACLVFGVGGGAGEYHGCGCSSDRAYADATLLRGHGTRIDIGNKNIGAYKYSFNPLQVSYLPPEWKPPAATVQGFVTSIIKRDS